MSKVLTVAVREFLATVRTRAFLLTVLMMPALITLAIFGTQLVHKFSEEEEVPLRRLALVDHSNQLADELQTKVAQHNELRPNQPLELEIINPAQADQSELATRVREGDLDGYIILAENVIAPDGNGAQLARRDNKLIEGERFQRMINEAVYAARMEQAGIDVAKVAAARQPINVELVDAESGEAVTGDRMARVMTPFAFMFLLFMGTFGIAQGLLTSVIEEKSSRIVEVLLSAVSPMQLMAGKITGMVAVGLLLICVWGSVGFLGAQQYRLTDIVTAQRLIYVVVYFIPGFLFMASLLAGIGAACNELKEAQSMVFPLSFITVIPMIFWFYIAEYPSSLFSIILSYVPPITPFIMILRICSDPDTPLWQILTTLAVLWAAVIAAMWAAGKVFRVGVLMYGKSPSPRELLRWVRYS